MVIILPTNSLCTRLKQCTRQLIRKQIGSQEERHLPQATPLSVMFDVWNSTFRLDNLRFYANTPDTAVGLIRSSTFVPSLIIRIAVSAATGERTSLIFSIHE
ncbi:hypothetical protein BLNAU_6108 [Blattamonas nauphoetae]|uniref:Uncharacterized protein n=1 Tax=Blattamonas nauphoetae TaxID=2049346 RepID=A0ABQ9Y560_9EUKA|nr:hypothetical protein BLNAU_6108 [Blattamonas nauphoetae]